MAVVTSCEYAPLYRSLKMSETTPKGRLAHFNPWSRVNMKNLLDSEARIYGRIIIKRKSVFFSRQLGINCFREQVGHFEITRKSDLFTRTINPLLFLEQTVFLYKFFSMFHLLLHL